MSRLAHPRRVRLRPGRLPRRGHGSLGGHRHGHRVQPDHRALRPALLPGTGGAGGLVTFEKSDKETEVDGDTPLLEAGEQCGVVMPSGCRMGICRSCLTPSPAGGMDLRTGEVHGDEGELIQTYLLLPDPSTWTSEKGTSHMTTTVNTCTDTRPGPRPRPAKPATRTLPPSARAPSLGPDADADRSIPGRAMSAQRPPPTSVTPMSSASARSRRAP